MSTLTNVLPPSIQQQSSNLLTPTSQPVPLLSTPLAKGYSYAYTLGTLIYYYLRAGALVKDPVQTLVQDVVPIAVFQSLFCAICLPVSGTWYSGTGDVGRGGKAVENAAAAKKAGSSTGAGNPRRKAGIVGGPWQTRIMVRFCNINSRAC